ncbi:MAG TPA: BlaI/MecI/CopY family transcriptional regulator [Longimicrobiales bacterium]|nr:BlaI/MecI/CopY family transcriptional regulator [Longimicrobiales bacterium]
MPKKFELTDLQLDILSVLWGRGPASAADVTEALHKRRKLANTTIATMLARLEKKGVVTHTVHGRVYLYRAAVTEEQVRGSMLSRVAAAFRGDVAAIVNQLLDRDLDADEIARVRKLVDERARKLKEKK